MSYATVEERIHSIPEEYLDDVAEYIDYILFKAKKRSDATAKGTAGYFGSISNPIDGMALQRSMRNEWD